MPVDTARRSTSTAADGVRGPLVSSLMTGTLARPFDSSHPLSDVAHIPLLIGRKGRHGQGAEPTANARAGQAVTLPDMTVKHTISFDNEAAFLLERAAARAGISMSAWISQATRREALRLGAGPQRDVEEHARYDEQEWLAAEGAA